MTVRFIGSELEGNSRRADGLAAHAEGHQTQATASYAHAEGNSTTASGLASHAEGSVNTASGSYAHAEGNGAVASGAISHAGGQSATASRYGQWARSNLAPTGRGQSQYSIFVMTQYTANTVQLPLTLDGGTTLTYTGTSTNVITIPIRSVFKFTGQVAARTVGVSGGNQGWDVSGLIVRESSGSARLVSSTVSPFVDSTAIGTVTIQAETTNNFLNILVASTANVATTWFAHVNVLELSASS